MLNRLCIVCQSWTAYQAGTSARGSLTCTDMRQVDAPQDGYRNVFCSACIEIRRVPITERYCPTCGIEFPTRPPAQEASINMAMSRATAAAGQRLNGGAPAGPPLDDTLDENGHLRNETMLTLLQQLEESLMGMGDGDGDGGPFGGAMGGQQGKGTPAAIIERLPRHVLHKTSAALLSIQITAECPEGGQPLKIDAVLADFSLVPEDGLRVTLGVANPLTGHEAFKNPSGALSGRTVLVKRGVASFASMALRAERAGGNGTLVINHVDVWPYTMKDSKKEVEAGGGLKHLVAMIPKASGEALLELHGNGARCGKDVQLSFAVSELEDECIICQELYQEGAELMRLPCNHSYHEDCVRKWLRLQHTCPTCRHALPMNSEAPILGPDAERARERNVMERMFS